jgi:hypothetical protein
MSPPTAPPLPAFAAKLTVVLTVPAVPPLHVSVGPPEMMIEDAFPLDPAVAPFVTLTPATGAATVIAAVCPTVSQ